MTWSFAGNTLSCMSYLVFFFSEMQKQIQSQETLIVELEQKIAMKEDEMKKIDDLFASTTQELEETKSCLEITTDNLKQTKHELKETKEERDEKDFFACAHRENEEDLHKKAKKLLNTVERNVEDLDLLHAKVDRKKDVETHNSSIKGSLEEELHQCSAKVESSMMEFRREISVFLSQMQQKISKCNMWWTMILCEA